MNPPQKNEKTFPRYMHLDGFGKFLEDFCPEIFVKEICQKTLLGDL